MGELSRLYQRHWDAHEHYQAVLRDFQQSQQGVATVGVRNGIIPRQLAPSLWHAYALGWVAGATGDPAYYQHGFARTDERAPVWDAGCSAAQSMKLVCGSVTVAPGTDNAARALRQQEVPVLEFVLPENDEGVKPDAD
jgi:hypothetical protein